MDESSVVTLFVIAFVLLPLPLGEGRGEGLKANTPL
jgi:hypothetical protein